MALYFVDVEATGINYKDDRIIQLAVIKRDGERVEIYNDLCYTDVPMSFSAMGVHHITPQMIEEKYWPYETDAFLALESSNNPANYFISHNNELDIAMLKNEGLTLEMKLIDTDRCSRHLLKDAEDYKLQTLRYQYGLYQKEQETALHLGIGEMRAHDALSDVLWHYMLFELLLERAGGDVDRLADLTQTPILLEKITFGKYKNKNLTFEELFATNPGDFVWMYNHIAKDWPDLEYTVKHWLQNDPHYWRIAQEERKKLSWMD